MNDRLCEYCGQAKPDTVVGRFCVPCRDILNELYRAFIQGELAGEFSDRIVEIAKTVRRAEPCEHKFDYPSKDEVHRSISEKLPLPMKRCVLCKITEAQAIFAMGTRGPVFLSSATCYICGRPADYLIVDRGAHYCAEHSSPKAYEAGYDAGRKDFL